MANRDWPANGESRVGGQAAKSRALPAIVAAGLTCGVMDISAAFITWWGKVTPERILQGVASGWLGKSSFDGGMNTAALGLFFHFFIAFSWATIFYLLSRKFTVLVRRPWISGPIYGCFVFVFMYFVVKPLSNQAPVAGYTVKGVSIAVLTHIFCVGLPIALMVAKFGKPKS